MAALELPNPGRAPVRGLRRLRAALPGGLLKWRGRCLAAAAWRCVSCTLCVLICPASALEMQPP